MTIEKFNLINLISSQFHLYFDKRWLLYDKRLYICSTHAFFASETPTE